MDKWLKSAVMATVTVIWAIYMLVGAGKYLFQNQLVPDPAIWGIPGMMWLALNPPIPNRNTTTTDDANKFKSGLK